MDVQQELNVRGRVPGHDQVDEHLVGDGDRKVGREGGDPFAFPRTDGRKGIARLVGDPAQECLAAFAEAPDTTWRLTWFE